MTQYVIEFGACELTRVTEALVALVGLPHSIEVAANDPAGPEFVPTTMGVTEAFGELRDGRFGCVALRTERVGVRYGLIVAPNFRGQSLSLWMGTVEVATDDWRLFWKELLEHDRLCFACVGLEEGVQLSDAQLVPGTFPWGKAPMIVGALRRRDGSWLVRE